MGSKLMQVLLALYQGVIMILVSLALVIGSFGSLLSGDWGYVLWSMLSVPLGFGLAMGLPLLWAWGYQHTRTIIHKLRVYHGGRRDIVTLVHNSEQDDRSQV